MAERGAPFGDTDDVGYPTLTASDPGSPCLTQEPILPLFEGVALPGTWSRLGDVLEHAFHELWSAHGLVERLRPRRWVALQYGRIYVNAHGVERLRALVAGEPADPALVPCPERVLGRLQEWAEGLLARRCERAYERRLHEAEERSAPILQQALGLDPADVETDDLARGPFEREDWIDLLLPWLGERIAAGPGARPGPAATFVRESLRCEQRCSAELGRRFVRMKICREPRDIVYLTLEERFEALRGPRDLSAYVGARRARVESFTKLDLPEQFTGSVNAIAL